MLAYRQVVESPKPDLLPVLEQLPTSSSGKSSPLSGSDAWDTDFDDDKVTIYVYQCQDYN